MVPPWIARWPGKSPLTPDGCAHPAVYHMLDVAAVAEWLIAPFPMPPGMRDAVVLLAALHDLGKVSDSFRAMLEHGTPQSNGAHWEVSEVLLHRHDALIGAAIGGRDQRRKLLYAAAAGHHGRPPLADGDRFQRMGRDLGVEAREDSAALVSAFLELWPDASVEGLGNWDDAVALSWWLPGFIAAADWIGSNAEWFPPRPADMPPPDYLELARRQAERAIAQAGLAGSAASPAPLFSFALRPMQAACRDVPLPDGPVLAIIEDETGAGKTEAALILAQRMMTAGKGRGLFLALPTMATADAMFLRARDVVRRMFAGPPSLVLAHGRAGLSEDFRELRGADGANPDLPTCSDWLADNRRRALLADVGVGTVDQALLGVLRTRHATLRLFALSSKILVVDEVHELGDPYMGHTLAQLLRAHARAGGSAILLTATLPLDQRRGLIAAFQDGAGLTAGMQDSPAYPALTIAGGAVRHDFPQMPSARGPVRVERLADPAAAVDLLRDSAGRGAACVWVRNSVDEAIAAVRALRDAGVAADLLHARFALRDRKRHEQAALSRFGKTGAGRAGRVLVATQVVESSLDLDFDVMVSDLAPVAALIQRAGRLWRHMDLRPPGARPVPEPVLHVLSPDPGAIAGADWLKGTLGAGAYVYPLDLQWKTADVVFREGRIVAPSGLRALIEAVHRDGADVPPAVARAELERQGKGYAAANLASQNGIDFAAGYRAGAGAAPDTDYPTRLGQEQRVLMLARRQGDGLVPWAMAGNPVDSSQLSEVQASRFRLDRLALPDQSMPEIQRLRAEWPDWKRNAVTVCPVDDGGGICDGLRYDHAEGLVFTEQND